MASNLKDALSKAEKDKVRKETAGIAADLAADLGSVPTLARPKVSFAALQQAAAAQVAQVQQFVSQIAEIMGDWLRFVRDILSQPEEAQLAFSKKFEEAVAEVKKYLSADHPKLKEVAVQAYSLELLVTCPADGQVLRECFYGMECGLPGLIELGVLAPKSVKGAPTVQLREKNGSGAVDMVTYYITLRSDAALKLHERIKSLQEEIRVKARTTFEGSVQELREAADITFADLLDGQPGTALVAVPDGTAKNREGKEIFLPGGMALVESDGNLLKVVAAIGKFQRTMEEFITSGFSLAVAYLLEPEFRPTQRLQEEAFRKSWKLHSIFRRAVALVEVQASQARAENERRTKIAQFQKECDEARETMAAKATVSVAEWLMDGKSGVAFFYLGRKPWEKKTNDNKLERFYEVAFLAERNPEGLIRIADYPERLTELFGTRFVDFGDPGDKFSGLSYPLGPMLRTMWSVEFGKRKEPERQEALRRFHEEGKPLDSARGEQLPVLTPDKVEFSSAPAEEPTPAPAETPVQ